METKTIRLQNMLRLASQYKRNIEFCERVEMNPSYFSQIKAKKKSIGDDIARKVETLLGLKRGYLDVIHDEGEQIQKPAAPDATATAYAIETLPIPLRDQLKKLVFQIATYCTENNNESSGVGPFKIVTEQNGQDSKIPEQKAV